MENSLIYKKLMFCGQVLPFGARRVSRSAGSIMQFWPRLTSPGDIRLAGVNGCGAWDLGLEGEFADGSRAILAAAEVGNFARSRTGCSNIKA